MKRYLKNLLRKKLVVGTFENFKKFIKYRITFKS